MTTTTPTDERTPRPAPEAADDGAPKVRMDPRIRERRIQVRRDEGRRRLRVLIGLVAVACAVAATVGAAHSPLLDVDHVQVVGATKVSGADVIRAAGLDRHRFMVDVGSAGASRRIGRLPWIATARVERHWPGTVRIVVTERAPVASVPVDGGQVALVDASGRVLAKVAATPPGVIEVDGVPAPGAPGSRLSGPAAGPIAVVAALPDGIRGRIGSVVADPGGEVQLRLAGSHAIVRIGTLDGLDAKMVALATLLSRADTRDLASIDVRVPAAPVLTRAASGQ